MRTRLWTMLLETASNLGDDAIIKGIVMFWCGLMFAAILYSTITHMALALLSHAG